MIIGIDASRANKKEKTGTEWYSYHLIRNIAKLDKTNKYILYTKEPLVEGLDNLSANFESRVLKWPPKFLWSQIRLSLEMLFRKPEVLFVPAHTIPLIHPQKTITVCHDVGFERYPDLYNKKMIGWKNRLSRGILVGLVKIITLGRYSNNELDYHRFSMKFAVKHARKIITPSFFTAQEIIDIYHCPKEKLEVVYLGYNKEQGIKDYSQESTNLIMKK